MIVVMLIASSSSSSSLASSLPSASALKEKEVLTMKRIHGYTQAQREERIKTLDAKYVDSNDDLDGWPDAFTEALYLSMMPDD